MSTEKRAAAYLAAVERAAELEFEAAQPGASVAVKADAKQARANLAGMAARLVALGERVPGAEGEVEAADAEGVAEAIAAWLPADRRAPAESVEATVARIMSA